MLRVKTKVPEKHVDHILGDERRDSIHQVEGKSTLEQTPECPFFRMVVRAGGDTNC